MKEKKLLPRVPPLTRREFLNYAWLAAVGLTLSGAWFWLLHHKEKEPIPKSFMLFGSSMGLDIGARLNGEDLPKMTDIVDRSWFLQDTTYNTSAYLHARNGARIADVINWIENDFIQQNNAQDIFIIIGGNELTSNINGDELGNEAIKLVDIAKAANRRFKGKTIHFVLPPPTLLDETKFFYEERRGKFNPAAKDSLRIAQESGVIKNIAEPIELDDLVMIQEPSHPERTIVDKTQFRDSRHFIESKVDAVIQRIFANIH